MGWHSTVWDGPWTVAGNPYASTALETGTGCAVAWGTPTRTTVRGTVNEPAEKDSPSAARSACRDAMASLSFASSVRGAVGVAPAAPARRTAPAANGASGAARHQKTFSVGTPEALVLFVRSFCGYGFAPAGTEGPHTINGTLRRCRGAMGGLRGAVSEREGCSQRGRLDGRPAGRPAVRACARAAAPRRDARRAPVPTIQTRRITPYICGACEAPGRAGARAGAPAGCSEGLEGCGLWRARLAHTQRGAEPCRRLAGWPLAGRARAAQRVRAPTPAGSRRAGRGRRNRLRWWCHSKRRSVLTRGLCARGPAVQRARRRRAACR